MYRIRPERATFRWLSLVATLALLPPHPISFTLPGATPPYTLTFRAPPKVVTGVVETNTGTPVRDAQVVAHRLDKGGHARTLTGAGGDYRINLSDGLWALTVKAVNTTVPSHWVYPKPPQLVHFRHDPEPERKRVGFTVVTATRRAGPARPTSSRRRCTMVHRSRPGPSLSWFLAAPTAWPLTCQPAAPPCRPASGA